MKAKRILCTLLVLCALLPLFPAETVSADEDYSLGQWQYCIRLHTSSTKNAEANVTRSGQPIPAIKATLTFSENGSERTVSGMITNTKHKKVDEQFVDGVADAGFTDKWLTVKYAPWSFENLHLENLYTDYYRFYSVELKVRYVKNTNYPNYKYFGSDSITLFKKYPGGQNNNASGGQELTKGKDFDFDYRSNSYGRGRTVSSTVNFKNDMEKEIHVDHTSASKTEKAQWDGLIKDQYSAALKAQYYNALKERDVATLEFGTVTGKTGTGGSISKTELTSVYGITLDKDKNGNQTGSYSYDPKKLFDAMCEKRVGRFTVALNLKIDGNIVDTANLTFVRDTFQFSGITFGNVNYTYTQGDENGITEINCYTAQGSSVKVTFMLSYEAACAISNYNLGSLTGTFTYTSAYLKSKDAEGNEIIKYANGVNGSGEAALSGKYFTLTFPYSADDDTGENSLDLVIEGGKIESGGKTYTFYDKSQTDQTTFSESYSTYRIDAKKPKITFSGYDAETAGYQKSAEITITSDEASFLLSSGSSLRAENSDLATLRLTDASGTVSQKIRGWNVDPTNEDAQGFTSQKIPLSAGKTGTTVKLSLKDTIEGEFTLVIEGEDKAKNAFKETLSGIKLDNKPPETQLISVEEGQKTDEYGNIKTNVSNTYTVKLSDASDATIYYMFTEKDPYTAKKLGPTETTGEDNDTGESGEIKTLRGQWLQKTKKATESDFSADGTTNLVITMPEGKSFSGSLIWYAVDTAGNKSDYTVIDNIKITNEKAEYEIRPSEVLLYKPSYNIEVISPGNTISYRWRKATTGRTKDEDYLFTEYRTAADGKINTADDPETASLDGEYILELKIQTPSGQVTLYPQKSFVFDGRGPEIRLTVPETAYNTTAGTAVSIDDRAGVTSAKGVIVTPRGEAMAKQTEFTIPVVNGAVENYTPNLSDLSSGAYALKITATDSNGHTETITSKPFYIRYGAPTGSVSIKSDNKHDGFPMIADGKDLTLDFDITESFQNAACADGKTADEQTLYYRVDTTDASGGNWRKAGTLTSDGDTLTFKGSKALTDLEFIEGKNTLYVQTMIYPKGAEITRVNTVNIADYTLEFYLDETAPEQPNVYINDIHTTGSVSGWIEVADNSLDFEDFGGMLTAECGDEWKDAVTIGGYSGGAFSITVEKNVTDAEVYIYDEAKNKVTAVFSVYGIDNEPPDTSKFSWRQVTVGDTSSGRKDAEASVTIKEMLGEAQFALIKKEDLNKAYTYSETKKRKVIADDYFNTVYYEESTGVQFTATKLSSEDAYFDGEVNNSYRLTIAGANGDWYVGVRAQDAVGNICDVVYGADTANGYMTTVNAAASVSDWSVAPHNAETKAVVTVSFNIPVYAEVKTQKNDDYLESVPENAQSYSQKTSFTITDYGTYYLYTADDLGRASCSEIKVEKNTMDESKRVTFGSSSGVTYSIKEKQRDPNDWNSYIFADLPEGQTMICPANFNKAYVLIVEPVTGSSATDPRTLLLPATGSDANSDAHGFSFSYDQSRTYAVDSDGNSTSDDAQIYGYTKLVYDIFPVYETDSNGNDQLAEITEQVLNLYGFVEGNIDFTTVYNYLWSTLTADEAGLGLKCAVVSEIDNTPPVAAWMADPEVLTYETGTFSGGEIGDSASFYGQWVKHPTPGNVTFTVTAQDKESGIDKIVALTYHEISTKTYTDDAGNEQTREIKIEHDIEVTPDSKTGIWSWDGSQNPVIMQVDDGNGKTIDQTTYLPLVITYYDSPNGDTAVVADENGNETSGNIKVGDKKAVKTLVYTFTDALDLTGKNGIYAGMFVNSLGGSTAVSIGLDSRNESNAGISTEGIIYKMPIEEGVDYQLVYTDKKGNELTDMATAYYNSATANIKILERGETRGLYVSNNSRAVKKELNIYQPQFTFSLRDKFGYTKDVTAQLVKTDTTPGEIEYSLYKDGATDTPLDDGKTNRPIEIRIAFSDYESGIQSFTLSGTDTITLYPMDGSDDETSGETTTDYGTEYECYGTISGNGTYNIVLYDKAGNKTVETFSISNVNTEIPTATSVTFSSPGQADVTAAYNESRSYYLSVKNEETEQAEIPYYTSRPVTAALSFSKTNVRITSVTPTTTSLTEADYIVNYSTSEITFLKSGTLDVAFSDDYGNTSTGNLIGVDNIDQTPPEIVPATGYPKNNGNSVDVIFELDPKQANVRGGTRKAADILVAYGGLVKPLADDSGNPTVFTFTEDRSYTLKVYDRNEPLASYYTLKVSIDKSAPKITLLEWWYGDTETAKKTVTPSEGALGYRVATDLYDRTGEDVTVRITTDAETRLSGSGGDESTTHTRVWDENGLFSFDTEKKNGQITSYGVDIRVIDKTPPVIDLGDTYELIYCELDYMNNGILDLGPLKTALKAAIGSGSYTAYDEFDGARTVLTDKVIMSFADSAGNTLSLDLFLDYLSSKDFDSSKPYTVTYTVSDAVGNKATAYRTVKLVGRNDTLVLVNGTLPDSTGKVHMSGSSAALELVNFSGTAYVKYQKGLKTMGQMKTIGEILSKNERGEYVKEGLSEGWHTFYIQTDKREYFTIGVYTAN